MQMIDHMPTDEERKNGIEPVVLFPNPPKQAQTQTQAAPAAQPPGNAPSHGRMEDVMRSAPAAISTAMQMAKPHLKTVAPLLPAAGAQLGSYAPGAWKYLGVPVGSAAGKMGENYLENQPIMQDVGKRAAIDTAIQGIGGLQKPILGMARGLPFGLGKAAAHLPEVPPGLIRGVMGGLGTVQNLTLQQLENQRRLQNQGLQPPPQ